LGEDGSFFEEFRGGLFEFLGLPPRLLFKKSRVRLAAQGEIPVFGEVLRATEAVFVR
jgi:hypothetical protein